MIHNERVKIYQLSKPIIDVLNISTYKLNNPIYYTFGNKNNIYEQIYNCAENYNYSKEYDYDDNKQNQKKSNSNFNIDIYNNSHPIIYYQNKYFVNFPIFHHESLFYNYVKSYQINYNNHKPFCNVIKIYNNYNNFIFTPFELDYYSIPKLQL